MSKDKKKKKKQKITYIDDGRTIADMSGFRDIDKRYLKPKGSLKEQGRTYFNAMKLMFVPMMVTIGIISLIFLIMWVLLTIGYTTSAFICI